MIKDLFSYRFKDKGGVVQCKTVSSLEEVTFFSFNLCAEGML